MAIKDAIIKEEFVDKEGNQIVLSLEPAGTDKAGRMYINGVLGPDKTLYKDNVKGSMNTFMFWVNKNLPDGESSEIPASWRGLVEEFFLWTYDETTGKMVRSSS